MAVKSHLPLLLRAHGAKRVFQAHAVEPVQEGAPEWIQWSLFSSANISLIDRANNWVRNSWQLGMAMHVVIKSQRLLQFVMARFDCWLYIWNRYGGWQVRNFLRLLPLNPATMPSKDWPRSTDQVMLIARACLLTACWSQCIESFLFPMGEGWLRTMYLGWYLYGLQE